jgi:hypothetical protein
MTSLTKTEAELYHAVFEDCVAPARIVELHYWASEPGVPDLVRAATLLPASTRSVISHFLAKNASAQTMAHVMPDGSLRIVGMQDTADGTTDPDTAAAKAG